MADPIKMADPRLLIRCRLHDSLYVRGLEDQGKKSQL